MIKVRKALHEFYDQYFSNSDIPIDSIEVFLKLLEEISKLKQGGKKENYSKER